MLNVDRRWPYVIAVFLTVGCTVWADEVDTPVYRLVPVTTRDIIVSASAPGTIEPVKTIEVKSKASGEIVDVRVEVGARVSQGDLLVRVDPRIPTNALAEAEADLEVAQARLANAEAQLQRADALHETHAITEQEYEAARLDRANAFAALVRAERSLEDAKIAFEDTEVHAPSDGIVLSRGVEVGAVIQSASQGVSGGAVLLRMADLDTVQVRTLVDETDIGKIQDGQSVTITVDAYPNEPFRGRVLAIEPEAVVQQNVTMFPVLVRLANENGLLRPGMNAEVEIDIGSRHDVLTVPSTALRTQRDLASAASVIGMDMEMVQEQLVSVRRRSGDEPQETVSQRANARGAKSEGERQGRRGERDQRSGQGAGQAGAESQFGGNYIVFALRDGLPTAVQVRTGLTDLVHTEVTGGLTASDTVLVLPSASLVQSQEQWQERITQRTGGVLGGGGSGGRR